MKASSVSDGGEFEPYGRQSRSALIMTDPSDDTMARVKQGLDALFAAEVVEEILAAVDFEAILAEEAAEDPVDVQRLTGALGRPLGKFLANRIFDGDGASGVIKHALGTEVGGRAIGRALEVAVERIDLEAAATELAAFDAGAPTDGLERIVNAAFDTEGAVIDVGDSGTDAGDQGTGVDDPGADIDIGGPEDGVDEEGTDAGGSFEPDSGLDDTGGSDGDAPDESTDDALGGDSPSDADGDASADDDDSSR